MDLASYHSPAKLYPIDSRRQSAPLKMVCCFCISVVSAWLVSSFVWSISNRDKNGFLDANEMLFDIFIQYL